MTSKGADMVDIFSFGLDVGWNSGVSGKCFAMVFEVVVVMGTGNGNKSRVVVLKDDQG